MTLEYVSYFTLIFPVKMPKLPNKSVKKFLVWSKSCPKNVTMAIYESSIIVQFSRSVVSDSLRPHESQHAGPPCLSQTSRVYSNSCPSSQWCHPAISSSVVPFSSCPQSLPASRFFPMSIIVPGVIFLLNFVSF